MLGQYPRVFVPELVEEIGVDQATGSMVRPV
jgi:hypothetical protein